MTARGWEDLSEILKSYEELQVEIGEELIGEFLQKRKLQEILPVITDCMRSINLIIRYRKFLMLMGFEKLFEQEDSVNVFDDDYYYDCIEVTPETLRKLPVEDEVIVNNSFLIHGFYNYKHLLLGRVRENENHTRYFIGVPGMYSNRDRFMASMFGFDNFKKSHRSDFQIHILDTGIRSFDEIITIYK